MKDLIAKNFGIPEKKGPSKEKISPHEELKVNISRYQAQGLNVEPLKELKGKQPEDISKGIEDYRSAVRILSTAQTIIRTLEGYGYTKDIEAIYDQIKDPTKAVEVLRTVEELKDRAQTEHNIKAKVKGLPGSKLSKVLKEKSEILKEKGDAKNIHINEVALDGLLDDLNDISDAFSLQIEDDPLLMQIIAWEERGYFVDGLKKSLTEDRKKVEKDVEQFEKDIQKMEFIKERFNGMDMTGFQNESKEIKIKFQYPHLSKEIENELDRIDSMKKNAEKLIETEENETVEEGAIEEPEVQQEEDIHEPAPEEVEPEPTNTEEAPQEPEVEEVLDDQYSHLSVDELMELAKDTYKAGKLEESLTIFKEILKKDPDSSKARFMIRRISSKL